MHMGIHTHTPFRMINTAIHAFEGVYAYREIVEIRCEELFENNELPQFERVCSYVMPKLWVID